MAAAPLTPELRVDSPDALAATADRVRNFDPAAALRVMQLVGLSDPGPPISILLASEDMEIARSTPRWIAGFAHSAEGRIVIFPARSVSYPYDSLDDVVRHEIAHVLIARAAGGRPVRRWFHEGLALIAERAWRLEDRTRVAFALTGTRWSARELDEAFEAGPERASAAYAISGALVRHVMREYGDDAPGRILARMAAGDSFELAFVAVTGSTVQAVVERFWRSSWWYELVPFLTSSTVVWFLVTLLGLYAIRTRRARRAARRKAWEEDEEEQVDESVAAGEEEGDGDAEREGRDR
jgi:hypothetical protein